MTRVAELIDMRTFRLSDAAPKEPGSGEVQVRVEAVGICGSDLHSYSEGAVGDTPCRYPMVLGHEPAGRILKVGPGVTGWSAGDLVAMEPALYCYHCEHCMAGRHNVCAKLRFMSMPEEPGFFRDVVTVPWRNLMALERGMSVEEGTLIEPLAVVLHSMEFVRLSPGETAAVFGAGPIGLMTIALLKLSGAARIWAIEPLPHRRELAKAVGADAVVDPGAGDPGEFLLRETHRRGVDVSVDCAAKGNTANQAIRATRNAGRVVFTGIPSEVLVPLEFHVWRRKELAIYQVRRSNHEGERAREILAAHGGRFAAIQTHSRPLEEIGAAFAQLESYSDGVGKISIRMGTA